MKALLSLALLLSAAAQAQTSIDLPLPILNPTYYPMANCHYPVTPHTIATGFSTDGNYVLARADSWVVCGHSGRGSNLRTYYYCLDMVWDLAGNFISATYCPTPEKPNASVTYTLPSGYEEYTVTVIYYGYLAQQYPVLVTP